MFLRGSRKDDEIHNRFAASCDAAFLQMEKIMTIPVFRPDNRKTLTVKEAAEALGIGRNQAYEAVRSGQIPTIKIGRRILVPRASFERLLNGEPA